MLLNRPKNINVTEIAAEVYINTNYTVFGKLTFENVNGTCIANCSGTVRVKNKEIVKLTEGFVWGEIKGNFNCSRCKNLRTLEGVPKYVRGYFTCYSCINLESLEGSPEYVGGDFNCISCYNLESLKGAPKEVGKDFYCFYCTKLKSLEGLSKKVGGKLICDKQLK